MRVVYFDEVKYDPAQGQNYYWLCALIVNEEQIWRLEKSMSELSQRIFGTSIPLITNEFHASSIVANHSQYKFLQIEGRKSLLKELVDILDSDAEIRKVVIQIDPEKIVSSSISLEREGFRHLLERVEMELKELRCPGIMIGDLENKESTKLFVQALSSSRQNGTTGLQFGRKLEHLLDTVHFTSSHYSRMLQLADFHAWLRQASYRVKYATGHHLRSEVHTYAQEKQNALRLHRRKIWPSDETWYRK